MTHATRPRRRPRRGGEHVALYSKITPEAKNGLIQIAERANVSIALLLERLIENELRTGEVLDQLHAEDTQQQGEQLPMTG